MLLGVVLRDGQWHRSRQGSTGSRAFSTSGIAYVLRTCGDRVFLNTAGCGELGSHSGFGGAGPASQVGCCSDSHALLVMPTTSYIATGQVEDGTAYHQAGPPDGPRTSTSGSGVAR